jgi:glycine dehydrogenase subunit 1
MGTYVPNTLQEQQEMLQALGAGSFRELFHTVPEGVYLEEGLRLEKGLSEFEVRRRMSRMAAKNQVFESVFRGAGAYHHYIPSIVSQITSKEEFVTAYTPYQAEISQGILQSIFEYQTMICELTGMDVSNASVYDGATAAAEAVIMCRERNRKKALISATVHPQTIETVKTYCCGTDIEVVVVPSKEGRTDLESLRSMADGETACILIQQPNFFGLLEDGDAVGAITAGTQIKYIMSCYPISLGLLKAPREYGADIAVGEGQSLGIPLSYGGPYLGFMSATENLMRRLPGRIVGETTDGKGNRTFVLTLQAREQHIRREKASSNICSNQALCAMTAAVYLDAMGRKGLQQAAQLSMSKAHYLAKRICELDGFAMRYPGEYFNEFVTDFTGDVDKLQEGLTRRGILGGYSLGGAILWCATEMNTREEIDALIDAMKEVLGQ